MRPQDINSGLTAETLRSLLSYDKESGKFAWLVSNNQSAIVGKEAGWTTKYGYIRITVMGRRYMAHRLAWLYVTGEWPDDRVDHRDTNRSNNKWGNLRPASDAGNSGNRRINRNNRLGVKGVELHVSGKFRARIGRRRKIIHLGLFDTIEEARAAYAQAAAEQFGEFARLA